MRTLAVAGERRIGLLKAAVARLRDFSKPPGWPDPDMALSARCLSNPSPPPSP